MNDAELRHEIYRTFAETGRAPSPATLVRWAGGAAQADASLRRLHDAHAIVLDDRAALRMALPFSAIDVGYRVSAGDRSWWANCAWDCLAIPATLAVDATIDATWADTGEPVDLAIVDGEPSHTDGFIHFTIPARRWWDDIVET